MHVTWSDAGKDEIAFRVDRSIDSGATWRTIAYRPPRINGTDPEGLQWIDFSAPPGMPLQYRVAACACDELKNSVSIPTAPVTLKRTEP